MESWQDGSRYEGGYKEGMKHGHGKYIWNDGSMYEGEWFENKINGRGIYIWPDGRKYNGEWKDNNMHGKGLYTWKDGRVYTGHFKDAKYKIFTFILVDKFCIIFKSYFGFVVKKKPKENFIFSKG